MEALSLATLTIVIVWKKAALSVNQMTQACSASIVIVVILPSAGNVLQRMTKWKPRKSQVGVYCTTTRVI